MKIIRASDCRVMPWKNGGGATTEIAASPIGAALDAFDWRISMARVAADGPFSRFDDIDRTLAVVAGNGMVLTVGTNAPVALGRGSEPFSFAGEIATSARLVVGEITDLNVMTRRGRFSSEVRQIKQPTAYDFADGGDLAVIVSCNGDTAVTLKQDTETLASGDAAIISATGGVRFRITPDIAGGSYLILLRRQQPR